MFNSNSQPPIEAVVAGIYDDIQDSIIALADMNARIAFIFGCWYDSTLTYKDYSYDSDTGMYYLQSRYYDPETGRFINADDTAYIGYDDTPISANIFAYCCNEPITYIDYSGKAKTPLSVFRKKAQNTVINSMKDNYAKIIVSHWFYGGGKTLETGRTRTDWSTYFEKNNNNFKSKICKYAFEALKNKKTSFVKKGDSLNLSKDGHGGYFTGYNLLNGSNAKVGGFCAEGYIRKIARNKYNVSFTFVFNDIVDPNSRYRNDRMWKKIMKNVVLYKGQGIDYVIKIAGGGV